MKAVNEIQLPDCLETQLLDQRTPLTRAKTRRFIVFLYEQIVNQQTKWVRVPQDKQRELLSARQPYLINWMLRYNWIYKNGNLFALTPYTLNAYNCNLVLKDIESEFWSN